MSHSEGSHNEMVSPFHDFGGLMISQRRSVPLFGTIQHYRHHDVEGFCCGVADLAKLAQGAPWYDISCDLYDAMSYA